MRIKMLEEYNNVVSITTECKAIKKDIFLMDVLAPGKRKLVKR